MKIIQNYNDCIGCGACAAVCPKFWEMDDDYKARPKNGVKNQKTGNYELEIKEAGCNKDAEETCPVQIIKIV